MIIMAEEDICQVKICFQLIINKLALSQFFVKPPGDFLFLITAEVYPDQSGDPTYLDTEKK